jgi:hypothetical protein
MAAALGAGEGIGIVRSMDSPGSRRLAGVDQAFGDGAARPPRELLDQLRERLGRLDSAHPSADPDRSAEREMAADRREAGEAGEAHEADETYGDDGSDSVGAAETVEATETIGAAETADVAGRGDANGAASADDSRSGAGVGRGDDQPGGPESGSHSGDSEAGYRVLDSGGTPRASPYRPWFMVGEPGSPWFIE